jgi:hypothetical protein
MLTFYKLQWLEFSYLLYRESESININDFFPWVTRLVVLLLNGIELQEIQNILEQESRDHIM